MSVRNGFLAAAVAGLIGAGCASQPDVPTAEMTRARTLIDQAERAGAQQYAAVELDQARDKLRLADAAADDGRTDEARIRAVEAAADAEFATARANSGQAQRAAEEVKQSTETLRREANRGGAAGNGTPGQAGAQTGTSMPQTTTLPPPDRSQPGTSPVPDSTTTSPPRQ